jgi:hypothetical protein
VLTFQCARSCNGPWRWAASLAAIRAPCRRCLPPPRPSFSMAVQSFFLQGLLLTLTSAPGPRLVHPSTRARSAPVRRVSEPHHCLRPRDSSFTPTIPRVRKARQQSLVLVQSIHSRSFANQRHADHPWSHCRTSETVVYNSPCLFDLLIRSFVPCSTLTTLQYTGPNTVNVNNIQVTFSIDVTPSSGSSDSWASRSLGLRHDDF